MKKIYVIDMINGFCKEGALHDKKILDIVPNIIKLLEESPNDQRIFITDSHNAECAEFTVFPPHCIKGTNESQVIHELQPYCDCIIEKNSTNATHVMNLEEELQGVDEVVITGCCTDICVLQFALTIKTWCNQNNKKMVINVMSDCIATYDIPGIHDAKEYQEFAIKLMLNAGIGVI